MGVIITPTFNPPPKRGRRVLKVQTGYIGNRIDWGTRSPQQRSEIFLREISVTRKWRDFGAFGKPNYKISHSSFALAQDKVQDDRGKCREMTRRSKCH